MRHPAPVDAMLLGTVLLWALNVTVTRYVLTNGWQPLSYGTIRYVAAIALFCAFTYWRERSFRIERRDVPLVLLAGAAIFANQVSFVYGVDLTNASTVSFMLATVPVFVGLLSVLARIERLPAPFWIAAATTFAGVALIVTGSGGGLSGNLKGNLVALGCPISWALYSLAITPLMQRYSPFRISSIVLAVGWVPLAAISVPQIATQSFHLGGLTWVGFAYAVIGPLFLTNILWFTALARVGTARAALFSNLQPFFAVVFAILLLHEHLHWLEVLGGLLIFGGIALERALRPVAAPPVD